MSNEVMAGLLALKMECPLIYKDIISPSIIGAAELLAPEWGISIVDAAAHICEMDYHRYLEEQLQ